MAQALTQSDRRTNADEVFDFLYGQIVSLSLLPGTRISEVDIAKQFGLSRQPVREAFIRLANLDLLLVRPQKATVVRQFSSVRIKRARFTRLAVESEVLRRACVAGTESHIKRLKRDLGNQETAIANHDVEKFHSLDYDFHRHLCEMADCDFMFRTISDNKVLVDRLCVLSLSEPAAMDVLLEDHMSIVSGIERRDALGVTEALRVHLSRLDDIIAGIKKSHAHYFED